MRPPVEVPLDIVDLIAQRIESECATGEATLGVVKACRLVNRTFADGFERCLFHQGTFTDASSHNMEGTTRHATSLLDLLNRRPDIVNHVKQFSIRLSDSVTHPLLPLILEKLNRVEDLALDGSGSSAGHIDWSALSEELREALLALAHGPQIKVLRMEYIQLLPATVILNSHGLSKLALIGSSDLYREDMEDSLSRTSPGTMFDLDISWANTESIIGWLSRIDHPGDLLGGLRSLRTKHLVKNDPHINAIISLCGRHSLSLESVDITLHQNEGGERFRFTRRGRLKNFSPLDPYMERRLLLAPLKTLKSLHITSKGSRAYTRFYWDLAKTFNEMDTSSLEHFRLSITEIQSSSAILRDSEGVSMYLIPIFGGNAEETSGPRPVAMLKTFTLDLFVIEPALGSRIGEARSRTRNWRNFSS